MPVVTVSRMFGSGGGEVAERVASALGWTLLDNAVVDAVAARLGVPTAAVTAYEERVPSLVERLTRTLTLASPELVPVAVDEPLDERRVLEVTRLVIEEAVAHGPSVLVGRGAQCLLAERSDAVHVFCHAPTPALIARVMKRERISQAEAEKVVHDTNRQREHYVKRHWRRDWLSPRNYHLCVDTEWLGVEGAAEMIATLARRHLGGG